MNHFGAIGSHRFRDTHRSLETVQVDPETVAPRDFEMAARGRKPRQVKLLVWDLDETLWSGTLLEGDNVQPRPGVVEILKSLDRRGILQSIASKNDPAMAHAKLEELGLLDYFLYPQIGWSVKSSSIQRIAKAINIGLDSVAFIDDQAFERDQVRHVLPQVMTLDAADASELLERPELMPRFITDESAIRREMYRFDIERQQAQETFEGPDEAFLASLEMKLTITPARQEDLQRAEELTERTNQLNSTGVTYNFDELDRFRQRDDHLLLVASLDDKYGTYGKIGLALVETSPERWTLRLLLMSCRVMARGVGTILMSHLLLRAREARARFRAEFRETERNQMMKVAYRFAGFKTVEERDGMLILENDLEFIQPYPDFVELELS